MSPMPHIHDTPAAIAERRRQAAADRARKYRAAQKEEGKPDAKAVDAALSEAASFLVSIATVAMTIPVADLTRISTVILKREGYLKSWSSMAVVERLRPRVMHDSTTTMPSRRLTPTTVVIEPPRRGKWTETDLDLVRALTAHRRDAVNER